MTTPLYLKKLLAFLSVAVLVLSLAGCGEPEKLPPDKVIEKAVPALQAANSFHFTMDTNKVPKNVAGLYLTKANGDVVKPDKLSGDASALVSGIPVNVKVVVDGKSQYMSDPASGRWMTMPPSLDIVKFFDPNGIPEVISNVKNLTDDGTENLNGTDTYRLKGIIPASGLAALSSEVTAQNDLTTTLWIGSGDFLLRRVKLQGPMLSGDLPDVERTIDLSDYNKDVKIETPVVK